MSISEIFPKVFTIACGKAGSIDVEAEKLSHRWLQHCVHKVTTAKLMDTHAAIKTEDDPEGNLSRGKAVTMLASLYSGEFRTKGQGVTSDPVETLMYDNAEKHTREAYKAANGGKVKGYDAVAETLQEAWLDARPHYRAWAEGEVKRRDESEAAAREAAKPTTPLPDLPTT